MQGSEPNALPASYSGPSYLALSLQKTRSEDVVNCQSILTAAPQGLGDLLDDLVIMETLVYECGVPDSLTLETLRDMSDYARIELMMDKVRLKCIGGAEMCW